jgi:hypothetical protein
MALGVGRFIAIPALQNPGQPAHATQREQAHRDQSESKKTAMAHVSGGIAAEKGPQRENLCRKNRAKSRDWGLRAPSPTVNWLAAMFSSLAMSEAGPAVRSSRSFLSGTTRRFLPSHDKVAGTAVYLL